MSTVKYGDIYTNPPKSAVPGARYDYREIAVLAADLISTQVLAMGVLPAGHRLLNLELEAGALDSHTTPTLTITVGLLNNYFNEAEASAAHPGWDAHNITLAIPAQVGGATGATTPAEVDAGGATTPALATGSDIITATTVGRVGGISKIWPATLTPAISLGISKKDRIIGVQFPAGSATAVAGRLAIKYEIDQP
jgi:hypothetical protein